MRLPSAVAALTIKVASHRLEHQKARAVMTARSTRRRMTPDFCGSLLARCFDGITCDKFRAVFFRRAFLSGFFFRQSLFRRLCIVEHSILALPHRLADKHVKSGNRPAHNHNHNHVSEVNPRSLLRLTGSKSIPERRKSFRQRRTPLCCCPSI